MQKIECVWEHNGDDTLLYASNYPGAYTRGANLTEALRKMRSEIGSFLAWMGREEVKGLEPEIVQDYACALDVHDADSDVLFFSEEPELQIEEYEYLKQLALKSAEDFQNLFDSIPEKTVLLTSPRKTFYGSVPCSAKEIYEHTKNVNAYYFSEIGIDADNNGCILSCRKNGFHLLERHADYLQNTLFNGSYGERWSLRKVLRRFIWHDRIHAKAMYRGAVKAFGENNICNSFFF